MLSNSQRKKAVRPAPPLPNPPRVENIDAREAGAEVVLQATGEQPVSISRTLSSSLSSSPSSLNNNARRRIIRFVFKGIITILFINFCASVCGLHQYLVSHAAVQSSADSSLRALTTLGGASAARGFRLLFNQQYRSLFSSFSSFTPASLNHGGVGGLHTDGSTSGGTSGVLAMLEETLTLAPSPRSFANHQGGGDILTSGGVAATADASPIVVGSGEEDDDEDDDYTNSDSMSSLGAPDTLNERAATSLDELELLLRSSGEGEGEGEGEVIGQQRGGGGGGGVGARTIRDVSELSRRTDGDGAWSSVDGTTTTTRADATPKKEDAAFSDEERESAHEINSKSHQSSSPRPLRRPPTVVTVVGGGLAGLLCALETLHRSPTAIVVLVEGSSAGLGGRVANVAYNTDNSDKRGGSAGPVGGGGGEAIRIPMVEVGATFIHGVSDNPLTRLALHYGLKTRPVDYESVMVFDADTGRIFSTSFVNEVKARVYNVARSIFFLMRAQRSRQGLGDAPLDTLFEEAVGIALHGFGNTPAFGSGGEGSKYTSKNTADRHHHDADGGLSLNHNDEEGSDAALPSIFRGIAGRKALYRTLRTDGPSLASAIQQLLYMKHFGDVDDVQPHRDNHNDNTANNSNVRVRLLRNIQQVLSWHFYWEIVQDQIAPLNSLGSYAYDNSLGFRGPDHVFDNPRGIQALVDAIIEDMAVEGGAVVNSLDGVTTSSVSGPSTPEQDGSREKEDPTPTTIQSNEEKTTHIIAPLVVVDYTPCEMVPATLREALVAYGDSDDGDETTATDADKKHYHQSVKKRRLILSVGCSVAQITDNQLPAIQQERRAEIQSILDNKRLAHRKELLGGSGIPTATTPASCTNANDAKKESSGSSSNKNEKENLQNGRARGAAIGLSSPLSEASPSVTSLSSFLAHVFDPAALAVVSFYVVGTCNVFDSLVWTLLSGVALPFVTAVYDIALGLARVAVILSIEACAYLTEVTSASTDSVGHQHRTTSSPLFVSSTPACSLGDRLWSAFFAPSHHTSCSFSSSTSATVSSSATYRQSSVVFDAELSLAKDKQKENSINNHNNNNHNAAYATATVMDSSKRSRPLPNLLPHHLRISANERQEMQNRFLSGEDPIPDRSEIMHGKRRSGTDKARAMSTKGLLGGGRSSSESHPRNQKNRPPPSPSERDIRKRNSDTEGEAAAPRTFALASWALSMAFELVSAHSYTRVTMHTIQRFVVTFVRNVRRQYRRASRRAASPLNKLLFLATNPFAALKWAVLEGEPITQALVAAGQVSVSSPIQSTTASSGAEYTNSYATYTPSSAYTSAVSNHLKERAKNGIRLHADSSLALLSSNSTSNCWWDSDVVVVTVPLGVLQKSVGFGSVGVRKPSPGSAAGKKTTTGAAGGEGSEETIEDESFKNHPLVGEESDAAAAAPRRQQSIGRNTPQLKTSSPPLPQERASKQLSDRSSEGGTLIFVPPLPLRKREAIASTGCSETLKIALQFRVGRRSFASTSSPPANTNASCGEDIHVGDEDGDDNDDEVFWPEGIDFFGIAAQKSDREHHHSSAGGYLRRDGGVIPVDDVDDLLSQPPAFGSSSAPAPPSHHANKSNMSTVSNFEGTAPHSYLFGDTGHIEIVNLHKHRDRNGILIIEVENALARYWSSFANETLLIESEVMPRLARAFCRTTAVKKEDRDENHDCQRPNTGSKTHSSCCKVPRMPQWFSINNYLKNPHIRCGFSYWRPGRDGRDNLVLRAGLWPHGHAIHSSAANLKATASVLFSPTSFLSLQQHHASLKKGLVGPSTPQKAIARAANPTAAAAPEMMSGGLGGGGGGGANSFVSSGVPSVAVSVAGRNRLLFAGEHTSPDMYGNMHGAIVEGQRAAVEVLAIVDHRNRLFYEQRLCFWAKTTVGRALKIMLDFMWWALGFAARGPQLEMASTAVEALI